MASTFRTRWNLHVLLIIMTAVIVSYTLVRMGIIELPDAQANQCPESALLSSNKNENQMKIVNYPLVDSKRYLNRLGLQTIGDLKEVDEPVVVTATSANHISLATGLINRLSSNITPKLKIVVYDVGMTDDQRKTICAEGKCEVKQFPFDEYPDFLENYLPSHAWKPVVIQMALQEFGFVIWMDSAVYIPDGNLQGGIDIAKKEGIAAGHRKLANPEINLAYETDSQTFKALGEEACAFKKSFRFNAALIFIKRNAFTYNYIMRPWVSCALTKTCIAADTKFYSNCASANKYGFCHRFDQSVLSIILNRLYHLNIDKIDLKDRVRWTKCYIKEELAKFNEMAYIKNEQDGIQCPESEAVKQ
ncbi:uncharacterized protein LOC123536044 [Mercenaria mercenaria]|uniref:uncharacterized protein LOC123536044 n=1 Tax=Mercenaria mercenaria TaxID=6596 RepID=UPI00234EECF4|nr:uncharacterized protein LOC123536044 [Mercenaria mercenaria]